MRLHVVSLPHTQTTLDYLSCAYTMKVFKFGPMMRALGHEVYIYGGEENEAECDEFVPLIRKEECDRWFGEHDANRFYPITWSPDDEHWLVMNARAAKAIRERRASKEDLVLLIAGNCQAQIASSLPDMIACEWGVGYEGIFSEFCAFESDAWRHYIYGKNNIINGRWYDTTIPNFFDTRDFTLAEHKDDYVLFIGRLVQRKGVEIAVQMCERAGRRLVIAGPGAISVEKNGSSTKIVTEEFTVEGDHIEYAGPVGVEERNRLMSEAAVTVVPTIYVEPFGGVAVESMLAGTPVVATDWGAFVETVKPGISGYRFRTLAEGAQAIEDAATIRPEFVQSWAQERYGLVPVGRMFDRWFNQLHGLWGPGWGA